MELKTLGWASKSVAGHPPAKGHGGWQWRRLARARRTCWALALSALVIGLVLPGTGQAQLSVDFSLSTSESAPRGRLYVSFVHSGAFSDIADSSLDYPCDLAGGASDGTINIDDALCTMWGGGDLSAQLGSMTVRTTVDGHWLQRTAVNTRDHGTMFVGRPFDIIPDVGYEVIVPYDPDVGAQTHAFTLMGPCEPAFPGRTIRKEGPLQKLQQILHVPYDIGYRTLDEMLCGVEDVDWVADAQGDPTTCDGGLFAWESGTSSLMSLIWHDPTDDVARTRQAMYNPPFGLRFNGPRHEIVPGHAYLLLTAENTTVTEWAPPRTDDCERGGL